MNAYLTPRAAVEPEATGASATRSRPVMVRTAALCLIGLGQTRDAGAALGMGLSVASVLITNLLPQSAAH